MEKIIEIKSPYKIVIKLDDNGMEIQRSGFWAGGLKGEKKLFYRNISAVNIKNASTFSQGFLQFTLHGSPERNSIFGSIGLANDENSIIFSNKDNIIMQELKRFVEEKISEASAPVVSQTVISEKSAAEQIKEFKELLDLGVITEEEFNQKKKQLLNL